MNRIKRFLMELDKLLHPKGDSDMVNNNKQNQVGQVGATQKGAPTPESQITITPPAADHVSAVAEKLESLVTDAEKIGGYASEVVDTFAPISNTAKILEVFMTIITALKDGIESISAELDGSGSATGTTGTTGTTGQTGTGTTTGSTKVSATADASVNNDGSTGLSGKQNVNGRYNTASSKANPNPQAGTPDSESELDGNDDADDETESNDDGIL